MMNLRLLAAAAIGLAAVTVPAQTPPAGASPLKTDKDKFSYALGMYYGGTFARQEFDLDLKLVEQGMRDAFTTNKALFTEAQVQEVLNAEQKKWNERRIAKQKELAADNDKKAKAFLAENKTKPGVVTTPSGLQYQVLTDGKGAMPGLTDMVTVNYRGTLLDGTEFDSSAKAGGPARFGVNRVIKGWTEALQMMKSGSKWRLFIPPDLAYGEAARPNIPPNSLLVFEVELLTNSPAAALSVPVQPMTSDIIKVPSAEEMARGSNVERLSPADVEREIQRQRELQRQSNRPAGNP